MKISELTSGKRMKALKIPVDEVPHVIIEPNYTCNSECRSCYNREQKAVKNIEEIRNEIDLSLVKRRVETFSILGGEPTLHPHLPEIIQYIKMKKCICQVLTNGKVFLEPGGRAFLDTLIKSGVDRIILHADCGQKRRDISLDDFIINVFAMFEEARVYYSLSITIYEENRDSIPGLMLRYAGFHYFDGILATIAKDPLKINNNDITGEINLEFENRTIQNVLHIHPAVYVPSSLDDNEVCWIMYFYYINADTGKTFSISSTFNFTFRKIYRFFTGRHVFGMTQSRKLSGPATFLTLLCELIIKPRRVREILSFFIGSGLLTKTRFHYIVIQSGPEWNKEKNEIQICYHCPDATIRHGKLTPVCLADIINPVNPNVKTEYPHIYQTVYRHMQEIK